ncbi:MAG TPA: DUF4386 family protein [Syntrophorhabdaceae bacterium]|nr:DUF4386 family protein [Syntrophorhabdaceae bacterium]
MKTVTAPTLSDLENIKRIGTGLAFILFPLLFVVAFALHPHLLNPHVLSARALVLRARHADLMQLGHALDLFSTILLVAVALRFMRKLEDTSVAWAGLIGAALAIWGVLMLATLKGALCLTMSAVDTVSDQEFAQMIPGLVAMFSRKGWMVMTWGIVCMPLGFAIQCIALLRTRTIPRWQSALFLMGMLLLCTPDGAEIVSLSASSLMAIALVPYGVQTIINKNAWTQNGRVGEMRVALAVADKAVR